MSICTTCLGKGIIGGSPYHPLVICSYCKGSGEDIKMENILVIALVGKAQSGKTTSAKYLVEKHGYKRLRIADRLKSMLYALGLTEREIDGDLKECVSSVLCGRTPRHAMITLGTEWGRDMIHKDVWVRALDRELTVLINQGITKFVIDDVRFSNEAKYFNNLKKRTGYKVVIVRVMREGLVNDSKHVSETEMDMIQADHFVANGGTLESLYNTFDEVVNWYFGEGVIKGI